MRILIALCALAFAGAAQADDRVLTTPVPAWCKKAFNNTGACVPGAKDYVLVDGKVIWVDGDSTRNAAQFWDRRDRDRGGETGSSGGDSGDGGASK